MSVLFIKINNFMCNNSFFSFMNEQSYQSWLKQRGVVANTSSFYMRVLRAVYNKAVKKNLTVQQRPFEEVYTGIDKTQKRALTIEALRLLRNLDLSHKKKLMPVIYLCSASIHLAWLS